MEGFFRLSEIQMARPGTDLTPKCGACGLFRKCNSPKMQPWGEGEKKILIIGEAPGAEEDRRGIPFVGASGEYLQDAVRRTGLNFRNDFLVTNAVICRPPNNKMPQDGKEVDYCRANLAATLREYKPKIVVTLGRSALLSVLTPKYWRTENLGSMDRWTGHRIPLEDFWLCPTWHPSFLMREKSPVMEKLFLAHLDRAFSIEDLPPKIKIPEIELLFDEDKIVRAIQDIDNRGGVTAFDYETNCLKPEYPKAKIYSCSISSPDRTIAYPFFGKAIQATSRYLISKKTSKIASNAKFEERWTLKHLGHPVVGWDWDTMLAAHVLDNRIGVCSIKFQAMVLLGIAYNEYIEPYLSSVDGGHYNRIHEIETKMLLRYNGMDSWLERRIAMKQKRLFRG